MHEGSVVKSKAAAHWAIVPVCLPSLWFMNTDQQHETSPRCPDATATTLIRVPIAATSLLGSVTVQALAVLSTPRRLRCNLWLYQRWHHLRCLSVRGVTILATVMWSRVVICVSTTSARFAHGLHLSDSGTAESTPAWKKFTASGGLYIPAHASSHKRNNYSGGNFFVPHANPQESAMPQDFLTSTTPVADAPVLVAVIR